MFPEASQTEWREPFDYVNGKYHLKKSTTGLYREL